MHIEVGEIGRKDIIVMTSWGEEDFDKERILERDKLLFPDLVVIIRLFIFKPHMCFMHVYVHMTYFIIKSVARERDNPRLNIFQHSTHAFHIPLREQILGGKRTGLSFL